MQTRGLKERLDETARALAARGLDRADLAVILGTGLGVGVQAVLQEPSQLPYTEIPHMPFSGLEGHTGVLAWGRCGGLRVMIFQGRVHCYEGYSAADVAYAIRLFQRLGGRIAIITNISGGLNPDFSPGDLMLLTDHINLMGVNPLVGPNDDALGPRFPDMSEPYSRRLLALAREVAVHNKMKLREGVYVGVLGPNLETRAEYRLLRTVGADAVGMSTIPEVVAACHAGMEVLGISLITDRCIPEALEPVDIKKLLAIAAAAEPVLTRLVSGVIQRVAGGKQR